jgi:hypothetical protein
MVYIVPRQLKNKSQLSQLFVIVKQKTKMHNI